MKFGRDKSPSLDVRQGRGLDLLLEAQLYERKAAHAGDWEEDLAVQMRPQFMRAFAWMIGETKIITRQEVLVAANRRVTVGDTTYFNNDMVAMAVDLGALDEPTDDIQVFRYWDFNTQYTPANPPSPAD